MFFKSPYNEHNSLLELFSIIFECCYVLYYIFSFSGKVFKAGKEREV